MWFRDDTPAEDAKSAVQEMFFNLFGGPLGSGIQQIASAFDDFNNGQWERGVEKMLPAFFRGAMKSYRLNTEGLKTTKGDEVMNAEYYTTGKLIAQSMGFEPTEVAKFVADSRGQILTNSVRVFTHRILRDLLLQDNVKQISHGLYIAKDVCIVNDLKTTES